MRAINERGDSTDASGNKQEVGKHAALATGTAQRANVEAQNAVADPQYHDKNPEDGRDYDKEDEEASQPPPDTPDSRKDERQLDLATTDTNASIAQTLSPMREFLFVACITLAQFLTQVGLGQVLAILHVIGDDFGITNAGTLSWLIAGYSLTVGTFILVSGRLGDVFGYKKMLIIGFSWYAVWSLVAGLSVYSNKVLFIFARVFQGIGPSICLPNGLAILGATYAPGPRKDMVFSIFGASAPGGSIVGALFASIFAQFAWWPWTFWSMSIVLVAVAFLGSIVIPDPPRKAAAAAKMSFRARAEQLDLLGGAVGITSLVLINFAWNQSGVVTWKEPYVYVCLILGILLVPVFFYIERNISTSPLIPFDALSADVGFVLACVACGWSCFGIWVYYIWQQLEVLRGISPLLATAYTCPVAISGCIAAVTTGLLLSKLGPAMVMLMALLAFTVGSIIMATTPVHQIYWGQLFVCVVVIPWGMDMSFPAATIILSNSVHKKHQGIAASLVNTVVNYSISLGLGFAGTVDQQINNGGVTGADTLKGYRGALYMAIGLASLGLATSVAFLVSKTSRDRKNRDKGPSSPG